MEFMLILAVIALMAVAFGCGHIYGRAANDGRGVALCRVSEIASRCGQL
jgi:uncharacterized membrane protein YtjA (UPF0391 family)